jgi:nuclear-control-of-ATPase protein 2
MLTARSIHEDGLQTPGQFGPQQARHRWKSTVVKSIALMDAVVQNVSDANLTVDKLDDAVATATQDDPYYELHEPSGERTATSLKPADVAIRLQELLKNILPKYTSNFNAAVKKNGKPSKLVRYWLPAAVLLVCVFPAHNSRNWAKGSIENCKAPLYLADGSLPLRVLKHSRCPLQPSFASC